MKTTLARLFLAGAVALGGMAPAVAATPSASSSNFFQQFAGKWTGGGTVVRGEDNSTHHVNCSLNANPGGNAITFSGSCRAMLIFSRSIGVSLQRNGNTFTGVYTGAKVGPAKLKGSLEGKDLVMTMTYPKPVNGDTTAQMRIEPTGGNKFRLLLLDQLGGKGPMVPVTNVMLTHQG